MVELINSFPDFSGSFGDKRIDKRAQDALNKITLGRSSSIRKVSKSHAEQKAFYRLSDNKKFNEESIRQDTSEVNLEGNRGRIQQDSGAGKTTKEGILGFFLHPCFVIDAERETALGYSCIDLWHREQESQNRHTRHYQGQPIEQKESYKWIEAVEESRKNLGHARQITVAADREADIYDLFGRYANTDIKLLIRSNSNRYINDGSEKIIEHLKRQPVRHTYAIDVRGDIRKGIQKRKAILELKWTPVELRRPVSCRDASLSSKVSVTVIEVKEKENTGGNIYWRLYTTHEVTTVEQALQIIQWYKQRWYIEQLFRLLKMQGFQIENSQLETGWAIRKLTMLALLAALRIIQMMIAYEDGNEQSADEAFTKDEQKCMKQLNEKLEGQTIKLSNPNKPFTLKWCAWIIARLGGWKGYTSQRKPGPIVLHRGFIKFYQLYEGWQLAQKFFKDVGTQ